MVRVFCDRCGSEVAGGDELTVFSAELGGGITLSAWRLVRELCSRCSEDVKGALTALVSQPSGQTGPANKKRAAT